MEACAHARSASRLASPGRRRSRRALFFDADIREDRVLREVGRNIAPVIVKKKIEIVRSLIFEEGMPTRERRTGALRGQFIGVFEGSGRPELSDSSMNINRLGSARRVSTDVIDESDTPKTVGCKHDERESASRGCRRRKDTDGASNERLDDM